MAFFKFFIMKHSHNWYAWRAMENLQFDNQHRKVEVAQIESGVI
jgi:hypothetical protein